LSCGLLAAGLAIAAPIAAAGRADAVAAPGPVSSNEAMPPGTDPASIDFRWHLRNPNPCVRDSVVLVVAGFDSTPCDSFIGAFARGPAHVVYHTEVRDSIACPLMLPRTFPIPLNLGLFPAGPQRIEIEWVIDHRMPSGLVRTETRRIPIEFVVAAECTPAGGLPFVEHVQIGPPDGRMPPCVPPRDSTQVVVGGHFPSNCFSLRKIELIPDMTMGPLPQSPGIRITVEDCACCAVACIEQPVRWSAAIKLSPLPPFEYKLPIELVRTSCNAPVARFGAAFPFVVAADCAPRIGCILPSFGPNGGGRECDARIGPGQPARLTLNLRTSVALSGLQGELAIGDSALRIARLAPAGPASGMLLRWGPTPHGAKFALISDQGAPIPPVPASEPAPPVLEIVVEEVAGLTPAPVAWLQLTGLLAADAAGQEVPWCPTLFADAFRFAAFAHICSGPAGLCDFNGDGREDIRDLVLMMRCLRGVTPCGDPATRFDCNQDQAFTIDDVLCCAERILGQDCAGCPPGETRDARDVKLAIGPPLGRSSSPGLPVRIEGTGGIGGARIALRFPDDRYDVTGVDFGGAAASWLHVSQVSGGRVLVGLIDPAGAPGSETQAVITLNLALKPGREAGGEVALESADFTARDGVRLAAEVPALRQPLGGTPRLALSESRPNPFTATARFAVTLDRPGMVDVGIYDLGGRRLVTIHRGELPAGTREFSWDGSLANGSRARDGVYFYRAAVGTETLARKLVLLRSP
jgi:hypothetical protein